MSPVFLLLYSHSNYKQDNLYLTFVSEEVDFVSPAS